MEKQKSSIVYNADGVDFTIYKTTKPTKSGPKVYWVLVDYSTGHRRLLNNKTLKAAKQRADKIKAAMVKGQADRLLLSSAQWQDVCLAVEVVRSFRTGESLYSVVREYGTCTGMLGSRGTLLDAVKFFLAHHKDGGPRPVRTHLHDAAIAYHGFKVKARKSGSHCTNIKSRFDQLEKVLPVDVCVDELTAGQLDAAVVGFGFMEKTMNEYRITLSNFFSWAAKQNPPLVPRGFNPAKEMERHKVKHREVEFLHVNDLRTILATAPGKRADLLPIIVLVCFAGLRPSEVVRLDWSEVGCDYIRLPGRKSKTGYPRQIPVQDNLKAWLTTWRKKEGPLCPDVDLKHLNKAISRFSGVQLPHDAMRHAYGTHRHQVVKNLGAVADEMGNTMHICRRHYLNAFCSDEEAREWFGLMPATASNIVPILGQADVELAAPVADNG